MNIKVNTKVRGYISGAIGEIIDIQPDKKGNRYASVIWKFPGGIKTQRLSIGELQHKIKKGAISVVRYVE